MIEIKNLGGATLFKSNKETLREAVIDAAPAAPPVRHAEPVVGRTRALEGLGVVVGGEADVGLAGLAGAMVAQRRSDRRLADATNGADVAGS